MQDLYSPAAASVEFEHDGGDPKPGTLYVKPRTIAPHSGWSMGWNGSLLTVGRGHSVQGWTTRPGGMLPEYRGGPARLPMVSVFKRGSNEIAVIAAVANTECVFWLLLLNEQAEALALLPVFGLDEPTLLGLADAAGVHYRRYLLDADSSVFLFLDSWQYFPGPAFSMPGRPEEPPVGREDWIRGQTPDPA